MGVAGEVRQVGASIRTSMGRGAVKVRASRSVRLVSCWKKNCRALGEVFGTVISRVTGAPTSRNSVMPTGCLLSPRVSLTRVAGPSGMVKRMVRCGCSHSDQDFPLAVKVAATEPPVVRTSISFAPSASAESASMSIHCPSCVPGVGYQDVVRSPSTAADADLLDCTPPKLVASAAEEDTVTRPPCCATEVSGPTEG